MIERAKSYLVYYMEFFGERVHSFVDLLPESDRLSHSTLDAKFNHPGGEDPSTFDRYTHPCWCCPELIYVDEIKGNEVWLHKRVQ